MARLLGNDVDQIERKDFHANSRMPLNTISFGSAVLASATAAASRMFIPIAFDGRIVEIGYIPGILSSATGETGGLNFQVYLGASAAAANQLLSATARIDTGTTALLVIPNLTTSGVDLHSGGIAVSAGSVLTIDFVETSASHSVGQVSGYIGIVWNR